MPKRAFAILLGAAFLALIACEIHGFRTSNLFGQELWTEIGLRRFLKYAKIYAAVAAVLGVLAPRYFSAFFVLLIGVLTAVSVGPAPLLAVVFLALSANALGTLLMGHFKAEQAEDSLCATLLGAAVYSVAMTFLARLPVNYPAVWAAILAAPILLDARPLLARCGRWLRALVPAERPPIADRAALALLVFVLIAHWIVATKPEAGADAL